MGAILLAIDDNQDTNHATYSFEAQFKSIMGFT